MGKQPASYACIAFEFALAEQFPPRGIAHFDGFRQEPARTRETDQPATENKARSKRPDHGKPSRQSGQKPRFAAARSFGERGDIWRRMIGGREECFHS